MRPNPNCGICEHDLYMPCFCGEMPDHLGRCRYGHLYPYSMILPFVVLVAMVGAAVIVVRHRRRKKKIMGTTTVADGGKRGGNNQKRFVDIGATDGGVAGSEPA